ncbi:hypothetical protein BJ546DRAFT_150369 [Cryomyces antarcticus]
MRTAILHGFLCYLHGHGTADGITQDSQEYRRRGRNMAMCRSFQSETLSRQVRKAVAGTSVLGCLRNDCAQASTRIGCSDQSRPSQRSTTTSPGIASSSPDWSLDGFKLIFVRQRTSPSPGPSPVPSRVESRCARCPVAQCHHDCGKARYLI